MAKVELKKPIVEEISENIKDAQSVIIVSYSGLSVEQDTRLRKNLREANVIYKVYKNTMMNFAFKGTDCEGLSDVLEGANAIAISKDDATAPARIIASFAKEAPMLLMKKGVIEGKICDKDTLDEISKIPSREELLSRMLGSFMAPVGNFARVIKQIAEKGDEKAE